MKALFENIFFKMGMIFILVLILLIPAILVQDLIHERMNRQGEAVQEVSSKHAGRQDVTGPVLTIPYEIRNVITNQDGSIRETKTIKNFHVLPDNLTIDGQITPKKLKRGIFEVVVYNSDLTFKGNYIDVNYDELGIKKEDMHFDKAYLSLGITDLKGVTDQVKIKLNDSMVTCNPGLIANDLMTSGLHARFPIDSLDNGLNFDFKLSLNGSEQIMFTPIGKVTNVRLTSPWTEPSFDGVFLPSERDISENGFNANWKVLHLNRNYPQQWMGKEHSINHSRFGVNLRLPVDVYQKSMRVAKYALLFIVLTYLVFFFVEILNRILIHPIQYILVGIALVLFYVLMLAFSEQMYFDIAYLLAASMTIGLILLYCRSVLKSWGLAAMTASILSILYGFIFIIIQMQDYALLFGSLGVFLILAVTMYFSRKVNWFEVTKVDLKKEEEGTA